MVAQKSLSNSSRSWTLRGSPFLLALYVLAIDFNLEKAFKKSSWLNSCWERLVCLTDSLLHAAFWDWAFIFDFSFMADFAALPHEVSSSQYGGDFDTICLTSSRLTNCWGVRGWAYRVNFDQFDDHEQSFRFHKRVLIGVLPEDVWESLYVLGVWLHSN